MGVTDLMTSSIFWALMLPFGKRPADQSPGGKSLGDTD
jgi:hypothetical protein